MNEARSARGRIPELAILVGVAAVILVGDQLSKAAVTANLALGEHRPVIGDLVQVWRAENYGASFSLLQGGQILFLAVSVVALGLIAYFFVTLRGRSLWIFAVLGLVLGGTVGNLIDRVRHTYVTDFISVGFGSTRFPTFNVADSSLVVGIIILVVILWFLERESSAGTPGDPERDQPLPSASGGSGDGQQGGGAG